MTTSKVPSLSTYSQRNHLQQDNQSSRCVLKWRQGQLLVSLEQQVLQDKKQNLPSLQSEQWLVECLKHSPVRLVRIDPVVGEARLTFWASACEQASKPVFLRLPAAQELPSKRCPRSWWLKRLIDWSAATLLLLVLSPVMLGLVCIMRVQSSEPIFCRQWCVGERGKLFRLCKFQSITLLGRWMSKYSLDKVPQLFNVLRGEMSLVGPRPWTLCDAAQINPEKRVELNALPGIIGVLQVETSSSLLELDAVNLCHIEYIRNWSLWQDLKILLLTMPKFLSGFGAY